MLKVAGNYFSDDVLSNILALIMQHDDRALTTHLTIELIRASEKYYNEYGLVLVTIWCLGEYGDLVLGSSYEQNDTKKTKSITESSLVELLQVFANISTFEKISQANQIKAYTLTTALKLSSKFKDGVAIESLRKIITKAMHDSHLEIQVRAIEYNEIFFQPASVKRGILEKMPPPPVKQREGVSLLSRSTTVKTKGGSSSSGDDSGNSRNLLLDLLGEDIKKDASPEETKKHENTMDLLSDIFGSISVNQQQPAASATLLKPVSQNDKIIDLFGSSAASPSPSPAPALSIPKPLPKDNEIQAYSDSNINFVFVIKENLGNGVALLEARVKNNSASILSNLSVLCAVTKQQKLQLSSISNTILSPGDSSTLNVKITGNPGSKLKIRVKMGYNKAGQPVNKQFDFNAGGKTL
ncbi:unnamed protein product [Ambrosiozyma monospora]|uniref:Unnamed protein product n=1 Tax=Ambrosiozyma monospora TaxID=43982 RepID=A0ACB5TYX5_AMBMO|nr:unnamed protein product [Ambrosiozyma monospora]